MRNELEKALVQDFPHVFYLEDRKGNPYDLFGCECSDGWEPSIRKAAEKLEPLFIKAIEEDPEGFKFGHYRTSQLKEKYGTGRWYLSGSTDEMYKITDEWEEQTKTICEQCGKLGKLRGEKSGWYYTSCNSCSKPQDRDNLEVLEEAYIKNIDKEI